MISSQNIPAISDILPHRDSMLLLDRLLDFDATKATAEYVPRANAWYVDEGGNCPAWIGIELMAQTIAAHVGILRRIEQLPAKLGALLGAQRYVALQAAFAAGETLSIKTEMIYSDANGFSAYECLIAANGKDVANATLKVFEPDNFQTFLQEGLS